MEKKRLTLNPELTKVTRYYMTQKRKEIIKFMEFYIKEDVRKKVNELLDFKGFIKRRNQ